MDEMDTPYTVMTSRAPEVLKSYHVQKYESKKKIHFSKSFQVYHVLRFVSITDLEVWRVLNNTFLIGRS